MRDSGQGAQLGLGTRHGQRIVELHVVPEMKAEFPTAFGEPSAFMEHPAHLGSSERSGYPVQLRVTDSMAPRVKVPTRRACASSRSFILTHPLSTPSSSGSIGLLRYLSVGKRSLRLPDAGENDACQKAASTTVYIRSSFRLFRFSSLVSFISGTGNGCRYGRHSVRQTIVLSFLRHPAIPFRSRCRRMRGHPATVPGRHLFRNVPLHVSGSPSPTNV